VIDLAAMTSMWKAILVVMTVPIFKQISAPTNICSSGVLENNYDAINELATNSTLLWIITLATTFGVMNTLFSLWIIKNQNAVLKVMLALLKTFLLWVFFMCYAGNGHEDFNYLDLIGMSMIAIGTVYFVRLELSDNEVVQKPNIPQGDSELQLAY